MKKSMIYLLVFAILSPSLAFSGEADRLGCQICGMYIDQYQRTAGKLVSTEGEEIHTCGLACLLRLVEDKGGPDAFQSILVKDWVSGATIKATAATYVISSNIVPDMLPNIIAFSSTKEARDFVDKEGGEILTFSQALTIISPTAMTMPARIKTAVLPAKGATGLAVGAMFMTMDDVIIGDDSVSPRSFINRPGQMMGPKEMRSSATMLMANYGITDDLAIDVKTAYLDKEMEMYRMGGKETLTTTNSGLGDTLVSLRYNLYKNSKYSQFASALLQTSVPTGDFDKDYISQPGLQLGTGDFTFGGGLLYTYRYQNFWLHSMASYTHKLENSEDFKFGDETLFGVALHYTPSYDLMFGLESDTIYYQENENSGTEVGNSGGTRSRLTGVISWRFLTALGGNFNLRLMAGLPVYEDLNHESKMGMEAVQMGGGYYASLSINYKRRYGDHH